MLDKNYFNKLKDELAYHEELVTQLKQTLKTLQRLCEHNWEYECRVHKGNSYKCSICGLDEER